MWRIFVTLLIGARVYSYPLPGASSDEIACYGRIDAIMHRWRPGPNVEAFIVCRQAVAVI